MRKTLITFSGANYEETTRALYEQGPNLGADAVLVYDDAWLMEQDFYRQNAWLWDHPHKRGFGWYAWKPYIIMDALKRGRPGDVVMYVDADCLPLADLTPLFDTAAKQGVMLFASEGHTQYEWCKRDCFIVMGQDEPKYYNVQAGVARFMLFQRDCPWAEQFLAEWLTYCVNPLANTFDPSVLGTEPQGFIEHRAEQAIMTNLAHKYGFTLYREACGAGEGTMRDRDLYGQLFRQVDRLDKTSAEPTGSIYFNAGAR